MRRYRYIAVMCAIAAASVFVCDALGRTRFFHELELKAGDIQFLLRGPRAPRDIVLVVIDQKALDSFPEPLMFWHPYYARAIQAAAAAGARAFGLDVTFTIPVEKWAPEHDRMLMQAVQEASAKMPVVCGYAPSTLAWERGFVTPINMIAGMLGQSAYVNLQVDPDDFVRQLELLEAPAPGEGPPPLRSLALRVAEKFLREDVKAGPGGLTLGGAAIPASGGRSMIINYPGPAGTFPRISLADFLASGQAGRSDELSRLVGGKIVLLGKDSIEDRHATPFYTLTPGQRANTAGVEIHAAALDTLLQRQFLVPVAASWRWLALFLSALAAVGIGGWLLAWRAAITVAAQITITILVTQALFRSGQLLSAAEMLLAASPAILGALVYRSLSAEKRGAIFRRAVVQFVDRKIARTLDENDALPAAGSRQMVTILFSDIRGFTAFCDEKDPVQVVELLNEYLRVMVAIIVRHGGQANKFIGDGIMAIFSDEDSAAAGTHAARAVRCGVEMARAPGEFRTGVGMHSGIALVGCVGSADKMDFTALGDTVNLASRLESLNKEYHTQLLMSETTREMLASEIETTCLGEVQVRGRNVPMNLFTVTALCAARRDAAVSVEQR